MDTTDLRELINQLHVLLVLTIILADLLYCLDALLVLVESTVIITL